MDKILSTQFKIQYFPQHELIQHFHEILQLFSQTVRLSQDLSHSVILPRGHSMPMRQNLQKQKLTTSMKRQHILSRTISKFHTQLSFSQINPVAH